MNADEIVRALRCEHGHLTNHGRDFMLNYTREEFFKILNESADLIESLQADLRHEEKISHGQMEQNKRLRKMMDKLQANLAESQRRERAAVEVVRCKDCRWKDTVLCRASKSVKYDLRREKHTYQTCMEPDGFCSIGERGPQAAVEGETK